MDQKSIPDIGVSGYVLGLDVGDARIGAAIANVVARLPRPLEPVVNNEHAMSSVENLIKKENITSLVIGLPRDNTGQETAQSAKSRRFGEALSRTTGLPLYYADESLSSVRAEQHIREHKLINASADSLAACFILEEFFATLRKENHEIFES